MSSPTSFVLPGERVLISSANRLLLSNKRVRYDSIDWGRSEFVSMTLDSVASCGLVTRSHPTLLVLSALASIFAFTQDQPKIWYLLAVAVAFLVAYFVTRRAMMTISSNGGQSIQMSTKGMTRESVVDFLNSVEREKMNYLLREKEE